MTIISGTLMMEYFQLKAEISTQILAKTDYYGYVELKFSESNKDK